MNIDEHCANGREDWMVLDREVKIARKVYGVKLSPTECIFFTIECAKELGVSIAESAPYSVAVLLEKIAERN